jgi:hypothetical protein
VNAVSDSKARPAHVPTDLLTLLVLPALVALSLIVGPQRSWLVLLFIGLLQTFAGGFLLCDSRSPFSGWFAVALGVAALATGTYFALISS